MDAATEMAQKRKAKAAMECLRYPGLGFVLEESLSTPATQDQAFGIQFVRPAAYISPLIGEERPQANATSIDVPLSP